MPFCPSCGAQVAGAFCAKCGSAVAGASPGGGGASAAAQPSAYPPPPQAGYQQPGGYAQPGQQPGYQQQGYQQPGYQQPGYAPPAASAGLTDNVAGLLCYLFGIITGIIFLVMEPYNKKPNIRFHAFQSIFLNVAWIAIYIVLGILTTIIVSMGSFGVASLFGILIMLVNLGMLAVWICMMVFAYQGKTTVLPIVGQFAQQMANK